MFIYNEIQPVTKIWTDITLYYGSFTLVEMDSGIIWIPNPMATLYHAKHVHIAQTPTRIPTPYFCTGHESEFESVSSNVNEPFENRILVQMGPQRTQPKITDRNCWLKYRAEFRCVRTLLTSFANASLELSTRFPPRPLMRQRAKCVLLRT